MLPEVFTELIKGGGKKQTKKRNVSSLETIQQLYTALQNLTERPSVLTAQYPCTLKAFNSTSFSLNGKSTLYHSQYLLMNI